MDELKPCPFCGGSASLALCGFGTARVVCMDCGSEGEYSPTREDAIAAWNRRTPDGVAPTPEPIGYINRPDLSRLGTYKVTLWPGTNEIDPVPVYADGVAGTFNTEDKA